ncbi:MAG: flagellin [Pirellulales bacterium]
MSIAPIPTSRVSDLFTRQRLTQQFQTDQLDIFRLQNQISTGLRINLPSDDGPAALRAITLQRLLERKSQLKTNTQTGQSFLAATDTALNDLANTLGDLRGAVLGVAGTASSQQERNAVIEEVNRTIEQLVQTGNRKFRGRFLFSGSQTSTQPYQFEGEFVKYSGNENQVNSYSDLNVLFASNSSGQSVFGGISEAVLGSTDLNPQVTAQTLLSSLRGGQGISTSGALQVSDGTQVSIVDLSNATSMGDVARFIEENPPSGRVVTVTVTGQGLTLQLDSAGGGNLTVTEVGSGSIANELGILEEFGVSTNPLVGGDLNPRLLQTDRLDALLGTKAIASLQSAGNNNDIRLEATANGTQLNGVTVQLVDDQLLQASGGITAGSEVAVYDANPRAARAAIPFVGINNDLILQANTTGTSLNNVRVDITSTATGGVPTASYDAGGKVLTINLESDSSSDAQQVITAIAGLAGNPFTATLDPSVEGVGNDGSGFITAFSQASFTNTGNSGGAAKTLYVHVDPGATTANQALAAINTEGSFSATLNAADSISTITAGTGLVSLTATATTSGGSGVPLDQTSGIQVVNGGQTYTLDFSSAQTLSDLLNVFNGSAAGLQAEINADGSGIDVRSRLSGSDFQIGENGGLTATQLGIRTYTSSTNFSDLNYGVGVPTADGFDLPTATGDDLIIDTISGANFTVDLSGANSIIDVVNAINAVTGGSVTASAVATGNVTILNLEDTSAGAGQFTVTQATGSLAGQYLGVIPSGSTQIVGVGTTLTGNDLNYTDLTITAKDGQTLSVNLSSAKTVEDVIAAINTAAANIPTGAVNLAAQLAANGNGIELVDATGGGGSLTISAVGSSQAAEFLGFVPAGQSAISTTNSTLQSTDRNYVETDSVFNTLIRLRDALTASDIPAIERAVANIDLDIDRVSFARAEVGARQQGLELAQTNLQDEDVLLRSALSEEIDVDLVEAISNFLARQASLEASLRTSANILQLTLLNFI